MPALFCFYFAGAFVLPPPDLAPVLLGQPPFPFAMLIVF
jgi:hypothetical protein